LKPRISSAAKLYHFDN